MVHVQALVQAVTELHKFAINVIIVSISSIFIIINVQFYNREMIHVRGVGR